MSNQLTDPSRRLTRSTRARLTGATSVLGATLFAIGILWQAVVDLGPRGDHVLLNVQSIVATMSGGTLVAGMALLCLATVGLALSVPTENRLWKLGIASTVGGFALCVAAAVAQLAATSLAPSFVPLAGYGFLLGVLGTVGGSLPLGIALWQVTDDSFLKTAGFNFGAAGFSVGNGAIFYNLYPPLGALLFVGPAVLGWFLVGAHFLLRSTDSDIVRTADTA